MRRPEVWNQNEVAPLPVRVVFFGSLRRSKMFVDGSLYVNLYPCYRESTTSEKFSS